MPANDTYIEDSLELNLFYLRIMKEHALFLQLAFTPKNKDLGVQAESIRQRMDDLMRQTIQVSGGYLSKAVMSSGELFTRYTVEAERQTQNLTGVPIDMQLTLEEYNLAGVVASSPTMQQTADGINQNAASLTGELLQLKQRVQSDVAACAMFTSIYPLQLDHLIREAQDYLSMLNRLNARQLQMGPQELADEQALMDGLMGEHALFIDGHLDPAETSAQNEGARYLPRVPPAVAAGCGCEKSAQYAASLDAAHHTCRAEHYGLQSAGRRRHTFLQNTLDNTAAACRPRTARS